MSILSLTQGACRMTILTQATAEIENVILDKDSQ
jgi:hypothetical protein